MKQSASSSHTVLPAWVKPAQNGCTLQLHVSPRSSRSKVGGDYNGRLKVALTAPPVDGKANSALIEFLAEITSLPKSSLRLERGETSREKTVFLPLAPEEAVRRVEAFS